MQIAPETCPRILYLPSCTTVTVAIDFSKERDWRQSKALSSSDSQRSALHCFFIRILYPSRRQSSLVNGIGQPGREERSWTDTNDTSRGEAYEGAKFGHIVNHFLSLSSIMSLIAGVRKACLFVLVLGVLAPRALADFAVCQAGWEWVGRALGFTIPR